MNTQQQSGVMSRILPPLWVLSMALLVGALWLLYTLKEIVVLLVVGYCIAYLIEPLLKRLEEKKISRPVGFATIFFVVLILLLLLILTVFPVLIREWGKLADNFPQYMEIVHEKAAPVFESFQNFLAETKEDGVISTGKVQEKVKEIVPTMGGLLSKLTGAIFTTLLSGYSITLTLLNLTLLPFIVFYLSMGFAQFHKGIFALFPKSQRETVQEMAGEIDSHVSAFFRGQLMVGAILFVLYAIGLWIVGVELWFLLAVISGFGNIIPYLGFLVGIVLSSIMAVVTFGDFIHVAQVWGVFAVVQGLEGTFITPRILGDKVGLSPLTVILAIFAGGKLFGLLGIFLAVPGAAVIRVLGKSFHTWYITQLEESYA